MGRRTLAFREWIYRNRLRISVVSLLLLGVIVFFANRIFIVINAGEVGVRFSPFSGTDRKRIFGEGLHVMLPWDQMIRYDSRLQQREDTIVMYAVNGLEIKIRLSTQFHVPIDQVAKLHSTVGPDYVRRVVRPDVISSVRSVIGNYTHEDIYAKDEDGLLQELKKDADAQRTTITYDAIKILEITLPDSIEKAIQSKLALQQVAQAQGFRVEAARGEAARKAVEAQGYADFARISGIPALRLRELEASELFAKSPNAKLILMGGSATSYPLLLNKEVP